VSAFRGFADHMETDGFRDALARLIAPAHDRSQAIMCAETLWWRCHRRLIADALVVAGCPVGHILGPGQATEPALPDFARIETDGGVIYDGGGNVSIGLPDACGTTLS
jgi:hypothetical protein